MQGSASTHWNKTEVVIFECHLTQIIGIPGSCHSCLTHLLICYTTLTSSEARYTHRCATSSAVHILPVFCLAMKSLYAWGVAEGHKWVPLQVYRHSVFCLVVLLLFLTKKKVSFHSTKGSGRLSRISHTCSGSGWAWILPLSDGVSTVPRKPK